MYPDSFSYFSVKTYVVGTHQKRLGEALLMSTHNICFHGEIRKVSLLLVEKKKSYVELWSFVLSSNVLYTCTWGMAQDFLPYHICKQQRTRPFSAFRESWINMYAGCQPETTVAELLVTKAELDPQISQLWWNLSSVMWKHSCLDPNAGQLMSSWYKYTLNFGDFNA